MKVHFINQNDSSLIYALAEIREEDIDSLFKTEEQYPETKAFIPKRKLEFLATRALMKRCCESMGISYSGIKKDEFGKPSLIDLDVHVSISHSYPFVACMINKKKACGIDIESTRPQLIKIKKKFLDAEELALCGDDLDQLCIHWAAKEALYKIYGRKRLDFSNHLKIKVFDNQRIKGSVKFEQFHETYELKYESHQNYFIVHSL